MADRFYGYQYGTNPRKINPEYYPYRKRYSQKEEPVTTTNKNDSKAAKKDTIGASSKNNRTNRVEGKRKIQEKNVPEYKTKQVANKNNNLNSNAQTDKKINEQERIENLENVKPENVTKIAVKAKLRIVTLLITSFSVLFAISYQNSLISESFSRKEQYKKEYEALSKTNQQIEVGIENNLNLNNIEQVAKDRLGMQKLSNEQKIYVSLPKVDYVAPATEQIVIEENLNFFEKLFRGITKIFK